mmetsp:Transcript_28917/g.72642  ORF Transcript_28917/g.72642 Transcript_28917/m.72642 type:complete len:93 (+) Transcript_28917:927-1205(+)
MRQPSCVSLRFSTRDDIGTLSLRVENLGESREGWLIPVVSSAIYSFVHPPCGAICAQTRMDVATCVHLDNGRLEDLIMEQRRARLGVTMKIR